MDYKTGKSGFDITSYNRQIQAFPLLNFDMMLITNNNASAQLNSSNHYDFDESITGKEITPVVNETEVHFITTDNYTMVGSIVEERICSYTAPYKICDTYNDQG
jgi:hypothetical protein